MLPRRCRAAAALLVLTLVLTACSLQTNTFALGETGVEQFEAFFSHEGGAACDAATRDCNLELGGFIEVAERQGWELHHSVAVTACPGGVVSAAAWDKYAENGILAAVRAAPRCDGVLLCLHGAMVSLVLSVLVLVLVLGCWCWCWC